MGSTSKKTMVFGASQKENRYSNKAVKLLSAMEHEVIAVGYREGHIDSTPILTGRPELDDIDTLTLYLSASRQSDLENYFLGLDVSRIIFNPGAENDSLYTKAKEKGIEVINACTLVMLRTGQY